MHAVDFSVAIGLFTMSLGLLFTIGCSFLLVCGFIVLLLKITKKGKVDDEDDFWIPLSALPVRFSYEELRVATKDFTKIVGVGRFGTVYKGMLKDGTTVAVKHLKKPSRDMMEFMAEVRSIGRIHHINLVNFIGYCTDKSFQYLVYEFMANGSLDNWIFNQDKNHIKKHCLNWQRRKKIAIEVAKGLAYLHDECHKRIIHLDIKPENILLDENFNARVSDFELSELIDTPKGQVLMAISGTPGYIAPECLRMIVTTKADVYSFGIVLHEMICRRRDLDLRSRSSLHLPRLLQRKSEENTTVDILKLSDEEMQNHAEEVEKMVKIAVWCLQDDYTRRPSMRTVVMLLEGVTEVESNIRFDTTSVVEDTILDIDQFSPPPVAYALSEHR